MPDLSDILQTRIDQLCAQGDRHADAGRYADALAVYWAAWDLLPEPQLDSVAATWILAAVGDANFLSGDFVAGRDNLSTVMHCPGAINIAFLHLRLGQCQYELGELARARDELMRAYLGGGMALFAAEDPKYLECLPRVALDGKGWRFWK